MTKTTKAENGAGSVFELPNGKWRAVIRGLDGKKIARVRDTENMAKRALKVLIAERDSKASSGVIAPDSLTVGDVIDSWCAIDLPNRNRAPATVLTYEARATAIKAQIGQMKVSAIRVRDLDAAWERMSDGGRQTKATLTKARQVLAMSIDFAIRREEMAKNLARSITIPRSARPAKVTHAMTEDQARTFLAAVDGHRWEALFAIGVTIGLRPGELTALCWDNVDLDAGTIRVARNVRRTKSGHSYLSPEVKTKGARRTVKLPPSTAAKLANHKARQVVEDMASGVRSDLVFRTEIGTIIGLPNLNRELRKITAEADLGDFWTMNELRHTAASLYVDQGVDLIVVADILGHADTRMLEMTYRKQIRPQVDGGVAAMTALFG